MEEPAGPTMMSKEARQLMLSGQGQAGLQAWKVRGAVPRHAAERMSICASSPCLMSSAVRCDLRGMIYA